MNIQLLIEEFTKTKLPRMYHLSMNDSMTHLYARIPPEVLRNKKFALEDWTIPRACVAPSIPGCLLGLQVNSKHFNSDDPNASVLFTVYEPTSYDNLIIKSNQEIIDEKLVFDAHISGEIWILNPSTPITKIATIRVYTKVTKTINYVPILKDPKRVKFLKADGSLDTYLRKWEYVK